MATGRDGAEAHGQKRDHDARPAAAEQAQAPLLQRSRPAAARVHGQGRRRRRRLSPDRTSSVRYRGGRRSRRVPNLKR